MSWFRGLRRAVSRVRDGDVIERIVDDRVFLLGLDHLYREAVKPYEREELLEAARSVAVALDVEPASVPVEGYYTEDARLTEYFVLMRALQTVDGSRAGEVEHDAGYRRLVEVTSAPIYGEPVWDGRLLPQGRDALTRALERAWPSWSIETLTKMAHAAALEHDDISLVGLAARSGDPVIITALRESVVLYAMIAVAASMRPPTYVYRWEVDADLAEAAQRFIATFNALFDEELPAAEHRNAERYWRASSESDILGRVVRLGHDDSTPPHHYHWAIARGSVVEDFWDTRVWTTEAYRATKLRGSGG